MNPFVIDRYKEGESSWVPFQKGSLARLERTVRAALKGSGGAGCAPVVQVRAPMAGVGKTHLLSRLSEIFRLEVETSRLDVRPENLRDWERGWNREVQWGAQGNGRLLVLDHLDAFHGQSGAGMRIARLVERMAVAHPRGVILMALNDDLWEHLFAGQLPSALSDLLSWEVEALPLASVEEGEGLLIHRLEGAGWQDHVILQFLESLELAQGSGGEESAGVSPRAVFRKARRQWETFAEQLRSEDREPAAALVEALPRGGAPLAVLRAEPTPAADQARKQLHAVAEALRHQAGPRRAHGGSPGAGMFRLLEAPGPDLDIRNAPERSLKGEPEVVAPTDAAGEKGDAGEGAPQTLLERFQGARLRFLGQGRLEYRPEILFALLRRVGEKFPSIRQRAVDAELLAQNQVLEWILFGRKIWIGMAPPSDKETWERTKRHWREVSPGEGRSKLAGFLAGNETEMEEDGEVDLIELSEDQLASLYAAEELARKAKHFSPPVSELAITGFLASELDYFWSRLTRMRRPGVVDAAPVRAVSS